MRKKWILLRITTYLELAISTFFCSWFVYNSFLHPNFYGQELVMYSFPIGAFFQMIFATFTVIALHQYLPKEKAIDKPFIGFYNAACIINSVVSVALIFLLLFGLHESFFHSNGQWKLPNAEDIMVLSVIVTYSFISIYTLIGAIKLKEYLSLHQEQTTTTWLEELGNTIEV